MGYALTATVPRPFEETVRATRAALADQGFGVLTEIDLAGTLKAKIGADIPAQVILGACRPALAHAAIQAEPSIGLLLPCNVVVRASTTPPPSWRSSTPPPWSPSPATTASPTSPPRPANGSPPHSTPSPPDPQQGATRWSPSTPTT